MSADVVIRSLLGIGLLTLITTVVLRLYGAPRTWAPALAILRGAAQLAALSFILSGVITDPWLVALALLVMFGVAATTAASRLGPVRSRLPVVAFSMAVGILVSLTVVFASGAIDLSARYALALGGMVIGNAMTTATLTGRNLVDGTLNRWGEVEGWLALGATPRQATRDIARNAVHNALVPAIDQTRTTGVVTLPGAFVGAIFGGISPIEAGRFQIVVLAAIMAAGAITSIILSSLLAPVTTKPAPLR